jgi:effector-binding domain-containing protein
MQRLRPFLIFLVFVVIATGILSLVLPESQKIERTVIIHAPARKVYEELAKLSNFNEWSVWGSSDSSIKYAYSGTDGRPGASCSWEGDPSISGAGEISIKQLDPPAKVVYGIHFSRPKEGDATSIFELRESNGLTTLSWKFNMATPRPWNIANLFYSMEKEMGKDFETSLEKLRIKIEGIKKADSSYKEVSRIDFPAMTFATIRQTVRWADMQAFFQQHFPILFEEASKSGVQAGGPSSLFYEWNEKTQSADIAAAIAVPHGTQFSNNIITVVDIPASKAVAVTYTGPYEGEVSVYNSIRQYMRENELRQKGPSIEQYITGPTNEKDSTRWVTKIVFLVE